MLAFRQTCRQPLALRAMGCRPTAFRAAGPLVLCLLMAAPAMAQSASFRDAKIREDIQTAIQTIDKKLLEIDQTITEINEKIAPIEANIREIKTQEFELKQILSADVQRHHLAVANLARIERQPLRALFAYDILAVQPQRQPILNISRKVLNQNIQDSRKQLRDLLIITHAIETQQQALTLALADLTARKGELQNLRQKQANLLTLAPQERRDLALQTANMSKSGDLKSLLQVETNLSGIMPKIRPTQTGRLPLDGVVVQNFGDKDPLTGLAAKGMRIAGVVGQEVYAVHDGRVLYSGPFKGYGNLVIMEHEKGVHSLYAGMENTPLEAGTFMNAGSKLGALPKQGDDLSLYLELRRGGTPADPNGWLPTVPVEVVQN